MKIFVTGATGSSGPVADALMLDQVVAARRSEEELGWVPELVSFRDGVGVAYREWKGTGA